jgi:predicted Zn-dependent peptidase
MGYSLDQNYDFINKINHVNSTDILKVTKKYFKKPFLSISGDEKICNEINKLWIKNF